MLFRESPLNSIWEGSGNVNALDVLRVLQRQPEGIDAWRDEVEAAGLPELHDEVTEVLKAIANLVDPSDAEYVAALVGVAYGGPAAGQSARAAVTDRGLRGVPGLAGPRTTCRCLRNLADRPGHHRHRAAGEPEGRVTDDCRRSLAPDADFRRIGRYCRRLLAISGGPWPLHGGVTLATEPLSFSSTVDAFGRPKLSRDENDFARASNDPSPSCGSCQFSSTNLMTEACSSGWWLDRVRLRVRRDDQQRQPRSGAAAVVLVAARRHAAP